MSVVEKRTPEEIIEAVQEALSRAWDMKAQSHGSIFCVPKAALMEIVEALWGPADDELLEPEEPARPGDDDLRATLGSGG